jgi:hypothetical protein
MAESSSCAGLAEELRYFLDSSRISIPVDHIENTDVLFTFGSEDQNPNLGRIDSSACMLACDLIIVRPIRKRTPLGREVVFRVAPLERQEGGDRTASIEGVARVIRAHIELIIDDMKIDLAYSVTLSVDTHSRSGCVDLVVPVPSNAPNGSEVVLRRVSAADCDVTLPADDAPVRVIVGFNHAPAPAGRVFAAAAAGNLPALTEALDDGCSTREMNAVSAANQKQKVSSDQQ